MKEIIRERVIFPRIHGVMFIFEDKKQKTKKQKSAQISFRNNHCMSIVHSDGNDARDLHRVQ